MNLQKEITSSESDIITGGIAPTFRLSKTRVLHFYGKTIEITDNAGNIKEIFQRIGGFYNDD